MNQVKAGAALNYVIIALNTLLGLCYTPYMLRMLGQNEYGLYSLVASVIAYLTLLDFGFGSTVVRYTAKYRASGDKDKQYSLFGLFLVMYSIIGIVAFISGLVLYFNIDILFDKTMTVEDIKTARIMILLLLVNLAVTFPMSVFGAIITAYENFIFQKAVIIGRTVLSTGVIVLLLSVGYKAIAMVVVQTVFNILLLTANYLYCRRRLSIKLKFDRFKWSFVRELLSFSVWVFLGDMMFKFYYNTGQFVLGVTSGTTAISIFALGITLMQMYIMFSGGISSVLLPKLTAMVTKNASDHEIADIFVRVGRIQFYILALILSGFIVFGKVFINLWAGPGYEEVYAICLILFFSTLIPLIQNTAITILQARNQQKYRSIMLLAVGALSLLLQVILSEKYQAIGCAYAVGIANLIGQGIVLNYYYHKYQHLEIVRFWKEIGKMMVAPFILTCVWCVLYPFISVDSPAHLGLWMSVFSVSFILVTWRLSLNKMERDLFMRPLNKILPK